MKSRLANISGNVLLLLAMLCGSPAAQEKEALRLAQTISMPNVKGRIDHMDGFCRRARERLAPKIQKIAAIDRSAAPMQIIVGHRLRREANREPVLLPIGTSCR